MKITITFRACTQDSQDYGSDDEHMISRVFFDLESGGNVQRGLYADLKQTAGTDYETGPIEVGQPVGLKGPFNWHAFAKEAEAYYRSLVGRKATGIRFEGHVSARMRNTRFESVHAAVIETE